MAEYARSKPADESRLISSLLDYCHGVPINSLRATAYKQLSERLDCEGYLMGDHTNDWCGLAEVVGYSNQDIKTFERTNSPTTALLSNWTTRRNPPPTIDNLILFLKEIQREDVVVDIDKTLRRDVDVYKKPARPPPKPKPVQHEESERFDAFVVYGDTPRDIKFMKHMVDILEGEEHNIKLFVPGRDDLAGTERYVLTADKIAYCCRRVIVILSKGFEKSEFCDFALKFTHSLSPGARSRRLIPILLDFVQMPLILNFVEPVNFTNPHQIEWAWPRVAATIRSPLVPNKADIMCTIEDLKNLKYDTKAASHMFYSFGVAAREFPEDDDVEG